MPMATRLICNTCIPSFVCSEENEALQHLIDNRTHGLVETLVWAEG